MTTPVTRSKVLSASERNVSNDATLQIDLKQDFLPLQYSFIFNLPCLSASSINPPKPTKSPCPAGYISWYLSCYKLVEEAATWEAAQKACSQAGGNLASIDMSYDQAFVAGVVLQGKADAWIGLRRKVLSAYYYK